MCQSDVNTSRHTSPCGKFVPHERIQRCADQRACAVYLLPLSGMSLHSLLSANAFKPLENIASQTDPSRPLAVCVCQAMVSGRNYSAILRSIFSKMIITPHLGPAAAQVCAEGLGNSHAQLTAKDARAQRRQKLLRRNTPQKNRVLSKTTHALREWNFKKHCVFIGNIAE